MTIRRLFTRMGIVSMLAVSVGLSAQVPAAASSDCYYYNYSNTRSNSGYIRGISYSETVWWTVGYSCNGQPMHENVTQIYETATITGATGGWKYQLSTTTLENGNGAAIWHDNYAPYRTGSGTISKYAYPNFWYSYDGGSQVDESMSSCSIFGGANWCEFWHTFASGGLSYGWW
jgi:hypothetical protein